MEIWKPIEKTNGLIEVSNEGRIRSILRGYGRILKTQTDNKGYQRVRVTINRVKITFKVHREVANAFIPNPNGLPQVNHKDGNKTNNSVDNLEWVTNRENALHAIKHGLWDTLREGSMKSNESRKRPIIGFFGDTEKHFGSVSEAEREIGSRHISDVLKGKRNHVKGWTFKYISETGGDFHEKACS